jgi:hypothetical protein
VLAPDCGDPLGRTALTYRDAVGARNVGVRAKGPGLDHDPLNGRDHRPVLGDVGLCGSGVREDLVGDFVPDVERDIRAGRVLDGKVVVDLEHDVLRADLVCLADPGD